MRHLFVMDPLEKLEPLMDTSLRMAFGLHQLGEESYATTPWHLSWKKGDLCAKARCQRITYKGGPETATTQGASLEIPLSNFSTVHMRKDPPFNMDYIATTWLLDSAPSTTKVYNSPHGLRSINEKSIILRYPEAIAPALISADPAEMLSFIQRECAGDAMFKPLNLYSGKGIHRLNLKETTEEEVLSLLRRETGSVSQMLLQPFDRAIYEGEVRVFAIHGKPLAWCLKKPASGSYMANSSFGSTRHPYQPSPAEETLITRISQDLQNDGIEIVGYDLIGGRISEINVTSPRLLTAPEDTTDYFAIIAKWLSTGEG